MIKTEDKHCYTPVREEGQRGIYRVAKVTWNQMVWRSMEVQNG